MMRITLKLIKNDFDEAYKKVDAILTPSTPSAAFKIGEKKDDPVSMYLNDIFTVPVNLAGLPGISIPAGHDSKGYPLGLQIIGKAFDEQNIRNIAYAMEEEIDFQKKGTLFQNVDQVILNLQDLFDNNDTVMLKASSKINFAKIIEEITVLKIKTIIIITQCLQEIQALQI